MEEPEGIDPEYFELDRLIDRMNRLFCIGDDEAWERFMDQISEGRASFRGLRGTILGCTADKYQIKFDDGETAEVPFDWLDPIDASAIACCRC